MLRSSLKTRTCTNSLFLNLIHKVSTEMLLLFIVQINMNETFSCERSFIAMSSMSFWKSLIQMLKIKQPKWSSLKLLISFWPKHCRTSREIQNSNGPPSATRCSNYKTSSVIPMCNRSSPTPTWTFIWFHFFGSTSKYSLVDSTSPWGSSAFCLAPSNISK